MSNTDNAMIADKVLNYTDDGDLLFSAPPKKAPVKPVELVFVLDEAAQMAQDLDSLRAGELKPMVRLTEEQMIEIETDRIGDEFCETPFLY